MILNSTTKQKEHSEVKTLRGDPNLKHLVCIFLRFMGFWNVTPYSLVDRYQHFKETCCHLHASILNMEVVGASKTSVPIYQTTWHHRAENSNLQI
jgi:hypothetical protein